MSGLANTAAPQIFFSFGSSDTVGLPITINSGFTLSAITASPIDTSANGALAALAAEVTFTVYRGGPLVTPVAIGSIATSGANIIRANLTTPERLNQNDIIFVSPSAAPGTNRAVSITLIGIWT